MRLQNIKNNISATYKTWTRNLLNYFDHKNPLQEFISSIVVFLVALPLCLGIAIASGVPPIYGVITGIVGGITAGVLSGCPLQVAGPAGGLIVITFEIVKNFGIGSLGLAVFTAGILQIIMGLSGLAPWLQIVSPAIIVGMLSGIGIIIFASQFLIMLSAQPAGSTLHNLSSIPDALFKTLSPENESTYHIAAGLGLLTLLSIIFWKLLPFKRTQLIPPSLFAVIFASLVANFIDLPIDFVSIPTDALAHIKFFELKNSLKFLHNTDFIIAILTLTFIASMQAILTTKAIDRLVTSKRTSEYN